MLIANLQEMAETAAVRLNTLNYDWQRQFGGNAPSILTPEAQAAFNALGLSDAVKGMYSPAGSTAQIPGTPTPNATPGTPTPGTPQVPQGARAVRANGKIIGYTTDGKTMIPTGGQ